MAVVFDHLFCVNRALVNIDVSACLCLMVEKKLFIIILRLHDLSTKRFYGWVRVGH